jgi:hypothetical protein
MSTPIVTPTAANRVVRFGVGGTLTWANANGNPATAGVNYQITGGTHTDRFSEVEATAAGNIFSNAAVNRMAELSVTALIYLDGGAGTLAGLLAAENLPGPLGKVTIANAAAKINGDWNYGGVTDSYEDGAYGRVTFNLHRKGNDGAGNPAYMSAQG